MRPKTRFGKTEQLDSTQGIESQIEFYIHRGIQKSDVGFGFTNEFRDHGSDSTLKSRVIGSRPRNLAFLFCIASLDLLLLDFKTLQLSRYSAWQRFVSNRQGMNAVKRRHL